MNKKLMIKSGTTRKRVSYLSLSLFSLLVMLTVSLSLIFSSAQAFSYVTNGALGRQLPVVSNFRVDRSLIAPISLARPGIMRTGFTGVTIHETSNWRVGANARMHAMYLRGSGQNNQVSWHYSVDDKGAYQSVPEYEKAWHAGDSSRGQGNSTTIAIEICDNADGNFDQAMANAEYLAADILYRYGYYRVENHLFQHNFFSSEKKNCPITIRDTNRWGEFVTRTQGYLDQIVRERGQGVPILSAPTASLNQAVNWATANNASMEFIGIASLYWQYALESGVNPVVAYAQAAHETGFGRFGGVIDSSFKNPCGLKIRTGGDNNDPNAHQRFPSWDDGVKAHLDHLALYAGASGYPKSNTTDPRHFPTLMRTAQTVESLSGKWAPSPTYHQALVRYKSGIEAASNQEMYFSGHIKQVKFVSYTNNQLVYEIVALNNGTSTWSENSMIRLAYEFENTPHNRSHILHGVTVLPGQEHTFTVALNVSSNSRVIPLKLQMVQDGVRFLGIPYFHSVQSQNAEITLIHVPQSVNQGGSTVIEVASKNIGLIPWTAQDMYRLAIENANISENRAYIPSNKVIYPGESVSFKFTLNATQQLRTAPLWFRMVQDGKAFFGEEKISEIQVRHPQNAEVEKIVLSDKLEPGKKYTALITVKNTDTLEWKGTELVRLGVRDTVRGEGRVLLPNNVTVLPGQSYTFKYESVVPQNGKLSVEFQMLKEMACWFGAPTTKVVPVNDASIAIIKPDLEFVPGQVLPVEVHVKNTGLSTWSEKAMYRLSTDSSHTSSNRTYLHSNRIVKPGETIGFTIDVKAPNEGFTPLLNLQMVQDGKEFFGGKINQKYTVAIPSQAKVTEIKWQDNPPANKVAASITVLNTGKQVWTESNAIRLGIIAGNNQARVLLPKGTLVWPGQSFTFQYVGNAPASGNLMIQAQMLMENVRWFGESLQSTLEYNKAEIISISPNLDVLAGQKIPLEIVVKNTGMSTWTEGKMYRLSVDNSNVGFNRMFLASGASVKPGETYTFKTELIVPKSGSQASVNLQMVQDGVAFFGEREIKTFSIVHPSASQITNISISPNVKENQNATISVTVKNTGKIRWSEEQAIRLNITVNGTQIRQLLPPKVIVEPGASYTFTYTMKVPAVNTLQIQVKMLQEYVLWFGDTKNQSVSVSRMSPAILVPDASLQPTITPEVTPTEEETAVTSSLIPTEEEAVATSSLAPIEAP